MYRITKRVEDRSDIVRDRVGQRDDIERGQPQILREGTLFIHADTTRGGIKVELAGPRLARGFSDQMPLARAALPDGQIRDIAAQFHNLSGKFMAGDQRDRHGILRPFIPVPDVDIRATNAGFVDLDQHVIRPDFRHRRAGHPQPLAGLGLT